MNDNNYPYFVPQFGIGVNPAPYPGIGFDEDGMPNLAGGGGAGGSFDTLAGRPSYDGAVMTSETDIPKVPTAITDLDDADRVTALEQAESKSTYLPGQVVYNTSLPNYEASEVDLTLIVKDLVTGGDASLPLNIAAATSTKAGVMAAADKQKLNRLPQTVVSGTGISQTSDDQKTSLLVQYKNILTGEAYDDKVEIPTVSNQYNGLMTTAQNTKLEGLANIKTIGSGLTLSTDGALSANGGGGGGDMPASIVTTVSNFAEQTDGSLQSTVTSEWTEEGTTTNTTLIVPTASATQAGIITKELYPYLHNMPGIITTNSDSVVQNQDNVVIGFDQKNLQTGVLSKENVILPAVSSTGAGVMTPEMLAQLGGGGGGGSEILVLQGQTTPNGVTTSDGKNFTGSLQITGDIEKINALTSSSSLCLYTIRIFLQPDEENNAPSGYVSLNLGWQTYMRTRFAGNNLYPRHNDGSEYILEFTSFQNVSHMNEANPSSSSTKVVIEMDKTQYQYTMHKPSVYFNIAVIR